MVDPRPLSTSILLTIALATYAVMPKFISPGHVPPDPTNANFNILFFGDFTRLSQQQFENSMEEIVGDHNRTYAAQVREIYLLGTFLARKKYRILRYAYLSFLLGLFSTSISFMIMTMLRH